MKRRKIPTAVKSGLSKKTDKQQPQTINKLAPHPYRNGGDGFILWVEENCRLPIYPPGSDIPLWYAVPDFPPGYKEMWENQKQVMREALRMEKGRFVYNLIVLSWQRGEGKSLVVCLMEMWKFFCWPRQNITLGANSKEQTKFVHYDIMRDIILNSPKLLAKIGKKNIQEKEIRLRDKSGNVTSTIRAISSFTGIVSNITGFTFSEMFDMKNPKFFTQLYGSIRNIPNALGIIDSTVSSKQHILYTLYDNWVKGRTKKVFFSHRQSPDAKEKDFWNPNMTQEQLNDYQATMLPMDFDQYFRNTWEAGGSRVFTREMVDAVFLVGYNGQSVPQIELLKILGEYNKVSKSIGDMTARGLNMSDLTKHYSRVANIEKNIMTVDKVLFTLDKGPTEMVMATMQDLDRLSEYYNTDWVILGGGDRADPMKEQLGARTVFSIVAKGLQDSRTRPFDLSPADAKYVYVLLGVWVLAKHTLDEIKELIKMASAEFDGIDHLTVERWGMWDLEPWCYDNDIEFEAIYPTYDKQKAAFTEFFILCRDGRFKSPKIPIGGAKGSNILAEEMEVFDHDPDKKWFGSPEKRERYGVQDDTIYSIGWGIYGGREKTIEHLRPRKKVGNFGFYYKNNDLAANY